MRSRSLFLFLAPLLLSGCESWTFDNPPRPDYRIRVERATDGSYVAIPPECADWTEHQPNMMSNEQWPQFGCATARNLALMVEKPEDLLEGRTPSPATGILSGDAVQRYYDHKTAPLADPNAKAPMQAFMASPQTTGGRK